MRAARIVWCVAFMACVLAVVAGGCRPTEAEDAGTASVVVPRVIGLTQGGAASVLERAGLSVGDITSQEISATGGPTILSQSPAEGTAARAGDAVDLVVSVPAVARVVVPDVTHSGTKA